MGIPYNIIADSLKRREVVPFLGAASSVAGATGKPLPTAAGLARQLARKAAYPGADSDPLTKVAQYLEEIASDRAYLLNEIKATFFDSVPQDYASAVTVFLAQLLPDALPPLIITTNFDLLVERVLERHSIPYLVIAHILKGSKYAGRLACYHHIGDSAADPYVMTLKEVETLLLDEASAPRVIVYKMHGTSLMTKYDPDRGKQVLDSIVLTENDYIDFFDQSILRKIPTKILEILRTANLLFLGYSLSDWNFRVMLRQISSLQRQSFSVKRHWGCLREVDQVEERFWDRRGISLFCERLEDFLPQLAEALRGEVPR